jgi:hypothetical protein
MSLEGEQLSRILDTIYLEAECQVVAATARLGADVTCCKALYQYHNTS